MPSPLRSFHSFPLKIKNKLEIAFLERFTYRPGEDLKRCREVLEAIACKRYYEEMNTARDKCITAFGHDTEKWKGMVPHWCLNPDNWYALCDIFGSEEWQGLSQQNKSNRLSSGLEVAHYGGSASMHQHQKKLTTLLNGTEPTKEQLYLHTHCKLANGKSPVVAQVEAAILDASPPTDGGDSNSLINPTTEGITIPPLSVELDSLHFTNTRAHRVYADVSAALADETNPNKDESDLFINAVGGLNRSRLRGFGCVLDKHLPTTTMRSRPNTATSVSGVTTLGERTFTESQYIVMLEERDRRQDEDREERRREQANNHILFSHLFSLFSSNRMNIPAQSLGCEQPDEVAMGNMPSLQDLAAAIRGVNQGGTYQSLLSQAQTGQEAANGEAAMNQWYGQGN